MLDKKRRLSPLQMFEYFLERERTPEGRNNFTLKNAHNAIVRDYAEPRFLAAMLAHIMQKEKELDMPDTPQEKCHLVMKAVEFDANRKRRTGFFLKQEKNDRTEEDQKRGEGLIAEAQGTFDQVLCYWHDEGDLDSQSRVLYEIAMIATELKKWNDAAEAHKKSSMVAEKSGNKAAARIALITMDQALREGKLETMEDLLSRAREHTAAMRGLAKADNTLAQGWVGNSLYHQGEVALEAGEAAHARSAAGEANTLLKEAVSCFDAVLKDLREGPMSQLLGREQVEMRTNALRERALSLIKE